MARYPGRGLFRQWIDAGLVAHATVLALLSGLALFAPQAAANEKARVFSYTYQVEVGPLAAGEGPVNIFLPIAQSTSHQDVLSFEVHSNMPGKLGKDEKYGNRFWHGHLDKVNGDVLQATVTYKVRRHVFKNSKLSQVRATDLVQADKDRFALFLGPNRLVPTSGELIDKIVREIAPDDKNLGVIAKATYDYVVDNMEYKKVGKGWGNGDTHWACSEKYGNCTDFHALFISLARARGIPARFAIGSAVPSSKSSGELGGYHCWVEFYLPEAGWVPMDASEARKHPKMRDLLFGTHPADRFELSVGRDIELGAGHTTGPLSYFVNPHVEVGGKVYKQVTRKILFREINGSNVVVSESGPSIAAPKGDWKKKFKYVEPYGFVRLDAIFDDSKMSNSQFPFWVESEDTGAGNRRNDSRANLHARLTRVGLKLKPRKLGEAAKLTGQVEVDFQNGGSESRAALRMRHAFVALDYGPLQFLAGQTWDVVSPLYPAANNDGMMWNAGNLGDRRPQARLSFAPKVGKGRISAVVGAGMTGAVDKKDLDENEELDGFAAAFPSIQGRLGLEQSLWSDKPLKFNLWGHYAREETATNVVNDNLFASWGAGVSLSLPIVSWLALEGEGWMGENLSDIRGGIGQGVNTTTGKTIASRGGWVQVALSPWSWLSLYLGGTMDDPEDSDLNDEDRIFNTAGYVVTRFKPIKEFQVGLEYLYWVTRYKNLDEGASNRVDLHFTYFF